MLLWLLGWIIHLLGVLALLIILLLVYKFKLKRTPPKVLKKQDWEQDVVYLFQFPLCPSVRSISPFAIKLETWLRMTGIRYENIHTMKFGSKGQIPYIELNGEEIPDSNVIIARLKAHFGLEPDSDSSSTDLAMGHAATGLVENHLAQVGFHYRYGQHMGSFLRVLRLAEYYNAPRAMANWGRFQPYATRFRSFLHGIGRHENSELWEMSFKDLRALSNWLGSKPFFLGASPTTVDCVLFGHLAQFLYIDIGFPQKTFMEDQCPNLVALVGRMKEKFWPSWDIEIEEARKKLTAS